MAIDAVVFDVGGVLAFDVWEHALLDPDGGVATNCGLNPAEVEAFGAELWKKFEHRPLGSCETPATLETEYWNQVIRRFNLPNPPEDLIAMTDRFFRPVAGMNRLLEKIGSRGIPVAICSNNNEFWIRKQAEQCGFGRFFREENVILSCRVGVSKISPRHEMFRKVSESLGMKGKSAIFVDDRFENIRRAVEYGWTGILFPREDPHGAAYAEKLLQHMGL